MCAIVFYMKFDKKQVVVMLAILIMVLPFGFAGCGYDSSVSEWENIAKTVIAETTKVDANFKITYGSQETIVVGDKMYSNAADIYYADYMIKDGDTVYYYNLYNNIWYKAPSAFLPENYTFSRYMSSITILAVVENTLNDLENVKDLGNGKYSYTYVSYFALGDPFFEYIFFTDGTTITKIEFRGVEYEITYGGQTITLPSAVQPIQLPAPLNLSITNGVLTWDEVAGAKDYYVAIYFGSNYYRGAATVSCLEYDLRERFISQPDVFSFGSYVITVRANFGVFSFIADSENSVINYYYS